MIWRCAINRQFTMVSFEFSTAARIVFGAGALKQAGAIAASMGRRALVALGSTRERAEPLLQSLSESGVSFDLFPVAGEPTTGSIVAGVLRARAENCDMVIGFGGGSAVDAGKAIAAMLNNPGELLDYLEVIGKGKSIQYPSAPCMAVPTTAGAGAEVTRNAVLASPAHQVKVSLRSPHLLPKVALVDPELTLSLPPAVTASTGMDALAQLIEPFVCNRANPMTDAFCREGMPRAARSLRRAFEQGDDMAAREDMSLASLLGGLALANAGLGAVHGFAGPIGGMFHAPHGAVCAILLPPVMAVNVRALRERQPDSPALRRYNEVAVMLTGNPNATAADAVAWVQALCQALRIPPLSAYGVEPAYVDELVDKSAVASSMKANPIALTRQELREIVMQAL